MHYIYIPDSTVKKSWIWNKENLLKNANTHILKIRQSFQTKKIYKMATRSKRMRADEDSESVRHFFTIFIDSFKSKKNRNCDMFFK